MADQVLREGIDRSDGLQAAGQSVTSRRLVLLTGVAYVGLTPLENLSTPWVSPIQVAGLLFLASWLYGLLLRGSSSRVPLPVIWPLLLIALWVPVTVMWSYDPQSTLRVSLSYASFALGAVAIADVFSNRVRTALKALAVGTFCSALYALWMGERAVNYQLDLAGVDQNITAFSLSLGLCALLYLSITSAGPIRLMWAAMGVGTVVTLIQIGSRTGVSVMVGIGIVWIFISLRKPKALFIACLVVVGSGSAFLLLREAGMVPTRVLEFLDAPTVMDSRSEITDAFLYYMPKWQYLGVGGAADKAFLGSVLGWPRNVHNGLWRIWIEFGVVGVALWTWLLWNVVRGSIRLLEWKFFALAAVAFIGFMYTLGPIQSNMLWVVFGLALTAFTTDRALQRSGDTPKVAPYLSLPLEGDRKSGDDRSGQTPSRPNASSKVHSRVGT